MKVDALIHSCVWTATFILRLTLTEFYALKFICTWWYNIESWHPKGVIVVVVNWKIKLIIYKKLLWKSILVDAKINLQFVFHSMAIASKLRIFDVWLIGDSLEM